MKEWQVVYRQFLNAESGLRFGEWLKAKRFARAAAALMLLVTIGSAAPLISDGDETASAGTVQIISPHPSWAAPIGGSSWISIAQTGWPLLTWLSNGTVISFSEAFSLESMPSSAMVTWAADDSASFFINGQSVAAEASTVGNTYSTCSDTAPTCRYHTQTDILPWLVAGENVIRFYVAQRNGWSYGLNYAVSLVYLGDPPIPTPEPSTVIIVLLVLVILLAVKVLRDVGGDKE